MDAAVATVPQVESLFDPVTCTFTHVVHAGAGSGCAIVDPVLDFDPKSGRTSRVSAQRVVDAVERLSLRVEWILETHAHADHLSAARWLRERLGGRIGIGASIRAVQSVFAQVFNLGPEFATDGSQFDHLFEPGEAFRIGALEAVVMHVPGHTPADCAYRVGDAVFLGDTLFPPDVGTARCDFPGGDAATLYRSIRALLELPAQTRLFMCHDYPPDGRAPCPVTTVAAQRTGNIHVRDGIAASAFVEMRERRDATLAMPVLILPAIQVNIRAGDLPPPEDNGVRYLKLPVDRL
ncbi:MAG: MBL fold metallo-hydrolase [bacterium]|jgi:glyoxylase-like metal-dependent hydrolase (beta-lactamase superfamily II)|nr:MBL fold metallo-hydrolase [Betaproteobacteria bacterium]